MPEYSTITLETGEGKRTILAGTKTALRIDSPAESGMRQGASFSGFAQRDAFAVDGKNGPAGLILPSSRVKQLRFVKDKGEEPARDLLEVTLAGGTGAGAWTRTVFVPISTVAAPTRMIFYGPAPVLNPPSKLILGGVPVAPNLPATHSLSISLSDLSSIKVDEPAAREAAA